MISFSSNTITNIIINNCILYNCCLQNIFHSNIYFVHCSLGTYDVLGINATIQERNYTNNRDVTFALVKCLFLRNILAKGVFLAFVFLNENNETDFYKSHYYPITKILASKGITTNIPRGNYRL